MIRRACALLVPYLLFHPGPLEGQEIGRHVYSTAELEAIGVHRFSELLEWIAGWGSSVNGLSWTVAPDALPTAAVPRAGLPEWTLVVDGQRVHATALGAWLAELSPVPLQQIDSVEVIRVPGPAAGGYASRGVLRVHTRRPARGASVDAWFRTGSETGDAGPYIFTPEDTPNVDRTGHDMVAIVGYGGPRWDAQLSMRHITHPATDPRLHERFGTTDIQLFVYIRGPALKVGTDAFGGRHELMLAHLDQEGFTFLPARGEMERSEITLTHSGASGSLRVGPRTELAYRVTRSGLEIVKRRDRLPARAAQRRTFSHGSVEGRHRFPGWEARAGLGIDERSLETGERSESSARLQGTLFLEVERETSAAWRPRLSTAVVRVGDRAGAKGSAGVRWQLDSTRALVGSISAARHLPYEGSTWMDTHAPRAGEPAAPAERILIWSELGGRQRVTPGLLLEADGLYGHLAEAEPTGRALKGGRFGVRIAASLRPSARLSGRVVYSSIAPVAASAALEQAMETLSDHSVQGFLTYVPVPGIRLGARLDYRSATDWSGADPLLVDPVEGVEAISRLDVSAEKWFWKQRIRAQLVIRNILNTPERYHPYGSQFDLRYFAGAQVTLPSASASEEAGPSPGRLPPPR